MDVRTLRAVPVHLPRWTAGLSTALLVTYVGGPSFLVFVCSVVLTAAVLQRSPKFRLGVGLLAALLVNLAWLMVCVGAMLPVVLHVPGLRSLAARPLLQSGISAVSYPDNSVGLFWPGSLLMLGAPAIISAVVLVRGRRTNARSKAPVVDLWTWLAAITPIVLLALMKWFDPWRAIAFTMSGDGRNHFLLVEEIRARSMASVNPFTLSTPKLSNTIAALFSSGNGASGTLQSGDLWGMSSVYVLSASILMTSAVSGFVAAARERTPVRWSSAPLVGCAFLLASNSLLLATCLRDGFMSLYFGSAVLAASLVLAVVLPVGGAKLVVLLSGLVGLWGGYSFLAPVLGVVVLIETYRWMWSAVPQGRRGAALGGFSVLVASAGVVVARPRWGEFERTAALSGAVATVDAGILWVLLALSVVLWYASTGHQRAAGLTGTVAVTAALVTVFLIERVPVNAGPSYSYYSSKTIVGTAGAVLCLSFIPLASFAARVHTNRLSRLALTGAVTAGGLLPFAMAQQASTLTPPWSAVWDGLGPPNARSAEAVVDRWGQAPYLFFRFTPSDGTDRIMDFWSPITWGGTGHWAALWNWTYNEMGSFDAPVLCNAIEAGVHLIYTRDPGLRGQVEAACQREDFDTVVVP